MTVPSSKDSSNTRDKKKLRNAIVKANEVGEIEFTEAKNRILSYISTQLDKNEKHFHNVKGIAFDYKISIVGKDNKIKPLDPRNSADYWKWRSEVFERDKYSCTECGAVGGKLQAHHIKSYSKFPELRVDTANGITLCEFCHANKHAHIKGLITWRSRKQG